MQVTKKSEYAILSALYLAKSKKVCDIGEIADSQKLSVSLMAKTLQDLTRAGVLVSRRGINGGYALARPASAINLLELIQAVDGPIALSDCLKDTSSCATTHCLLQPVWGEIQGLISDKLKSITLADILGDESGSALDNTKKKQPVILCDFDGTISKQDVSDTIFTIWLGDTWDEIDQEWHDGKISMVELYEKCWSRVTASEEELIEFVDSVEIDPFFDEFIEASKASEVPVYLVSDGFDYFIERVMGRHGHMDLTHYSNHLSFNNGQMVLGFNNQHPDCVQCANCKKFVMDSKREDADFVIYIGNGLSDRCAAEHADLIFAKDSLLDYCNNKGIPCISYQNFGEIIGYLKGHALFKDNVQELDRRGVT